MAAGQYKHIVSTFLGYKTDKVLRIKKSRVIGAINRLIQLCICGYLLIWVMIVEKGYQQQERGLSAISFRIHGNAYTQNNFTGSIIQGSRLVWDTVDTAVPPEENKAFFVTTSAVVTPNQTLSVCPEDELVKEARCQGDEDCPPLYSPFEQGHGVSDGSCNNGTGTCYIQAWCPLPGDARISLKGVENFTVLIKSHVMYSANKIKGSNVANLDSSYINSCRYNSHSDPHCPMFTLGGIVQEALSGTKYTFSDLIHDGAVIAIRVNWNCDLDHDIKDCFPTFKFVWMDYREDGLLAGYSYESSHNYFDSDGVEYREHILRYGILCILIVDAEAGKFAVLPTVQKVGSSMALLGLSTIICNFLLLYCHKKRLVYWAYMYEVVVGSDAYSYGNNYDSYDLETPLGLED
ncbi:P2X purinoceptor 4-like [Watersipora subatra]|uniref:P2X purinoceptor 4-like n=1 Tax=Watersipora subatra TaxID=2589382 RepID=UPI00355B3905